MSLADKSEVLEIDAKLRGLYAREWHKYIDLWEPQKFLKQFFVEQGAETIIITLKNGKAWYKVVERDVDGHNWWIAQLVHMETPPKMTTKITVTKMLQEDGSVKLMADQFPEYLWISNEILDDQSVYVHDINEDDFICEFDNGWGTYRRILDDEDRDQTFAKRLAWHLD